MTGAAFAAVNDARVIRPARDLVLPALIFLTFALLPLSPQSRSIFWSAMSA
jgi:hypothetical protein